MDSIALYKSDMRRIMNKKRRQRQLRRNIITGVIALILIISLTVALGSIMVYAQSNDKVTMYKYYTSIEVQQGETLWSIAEKNLETGQYEDLISYIKEILHINHLKDDTIIAGQNLIIPYFSEQFVGGY